MNEDLDHGSVLPFLAEARQQDWAVMVLNTNQDTVAGRPVEGSATPEEHAVTAWRELVKPARADKLVVVAHSYGGLVAVELARKFKKDFQGRVEGLLLTDSVHGRLTGDSATDRRLAAIGRNWAGSDEPLGGLLRAAGPARIEVVSAGHELHEWTTWAAMQGIFGVIRKIKEGEPWRGGGGQDGTEEREGSEARADPMAAIQERGERSSEEREEL
jgi:pimeloyl-ACP methyl ester carboxylesterase